MTFSWKTFRAVLITAFALSGCGDPAPGEGVDESRLPETMPEIVSTSEAINSADIPTTDLHTMTEAEYEKVIPEGSRCSFSYTATSRPVLAAAVASHEGARGVVKIHGRLVEVAAPRTRSFDDLLEGATFTADALRVQIAVEPDDDVQREDGKLRRQAEAVLKLDQGLAVGYGGWYTCMTGKAERTAAD